MVHYEKKKTKIIITDKRCFMDMCVNQTKAETNETKKSRNTFTRIHSQPQKPLSDVLLLVGENTVTMC